MSSLTVHFICWGEVSHWTSSSLILVSLAIHFAPAVSFLCRQSARITVQHTCPACMWVTRTWTTLQSYTARSLFYPLSYLPGLSHEHFKLISAVSSRVRGVWTTHCESSNRFAMRRVGFCSEFPSLCRCCCTGAWNIFDDLFLRHPVQGKAACVLFSDRSPHYTFQLRIHQEL